MSSAPTPIAPFISQSSPPAIDHADAHDVSRAVAELVAIAPHIRVMTGMVHAEIDGQPFTSVNPAVWVWATDNRFPPTLFSESSLDCALEKAWRFLQKHQRAAASQRAADEAEGGIIIPDYMY